MLSHSWETFVENISGTISLELLGAQFFGWNNEFMHLLHTQKHTDENETSRSNIFNALRIQDYYLAISFLTCRWFHGCGTHTETERVIQDNTSMKIKGRGSCSILPRDQIIKIEMLVKHSQQLDFRERAESNDTAHKVNRELSKMTWNLTFFFLFFFKLSV